MNKIIHNSWNSLKVGNIYQYREGDFVALIFILEDNSDTEYFNYKLEVLEATRKPLNQIFEAIQLKDMTNNYYYGIVHFYSKSILKVNYTWVNSESDNRLIKDSIILDLNEKELLNKVNATKKK